MARSLYKACSDGNHTDLIRLLDTHPYTMSLLDMTNRRDPPKAVVEKTIFNACLKGHYRVVKELLNCNVNPNSKCDLGTPIYAAVIADSLEVVKLLVDRGAEYRRVVGGFSPVFASCVEGRMKILRYLVNAGADLRCIKNPPLVFTACMQVMIIIFTGKKCLHFYSYFYILLLSLLLRPCNCNLPVVSYILSLVVYIVNPFKCTISIITQLCMCMSCVCSN